MKNSHYTHQIIIHINEGIDGTLEWAQNHAGIEYTWSNENIGICKALNLASTKATTEYICYFNDDMFALPNWDTALYAEIKKLGHHRFFFSSTMIEPFTGKNSCAIAGIDFGNNPENFNQAALLEDFDKPMKQDWNGASWPPNVVHRSLWNAVGGYSEEFSPGLYSDPDFSMKLWHKGVRNFRGIGNSRVYHFGSKSLKRIKMNDGRKTFKKKWGITPGYFDKYFLRKGTIWTGELSSPGKDIKYWLNRIRALF